MVPSDDPGRGAERSAGAGSAGGPDAAGSGEADAAGTAGGPDDAPTEGTAGPASPTGDDRPPVPLAPRLLRWTAVLAVAGVILYTSTLGPVPGRGQLPGFGPLGLLRVDKYYHVAGYAALAGALAYALADSGLSRTRFLAVVVLAAGGYGVALELLQLPLPRRAFSPADAAANLAGAVVAAVGVRAATRFVRLRRRPPESGAGTGTGRG